MLLIRALHLAFSFFALSSQALSSSSLSSLSPHHPPHSPAQAIFHPQPEPQIQIRNATPADVDAITDILVDAWAPAPEQKYVYQFRDEYPEYHWECIREEVRRNFQSPLPEGVFVNVIDAPVIDGDGSREAVKAVAVAVWRLMEGDRGGDVSMLTLGWPFLNPETVGNVGMGTNCSAHLDANITRARHSDKEFSAYKQKYIYGKKESQVYLNVLGTHPDYDGRGFGAAHCRWGAELAKQRQENVSLIATPPGWRLYRTVGFEEVANLTFTTVEGDELTWFEIMVRPYGSAAA